MKDIINVVGFDPAFTNWGIALHLIATAPMQKVLKSTDRLRRAKEIKNGIVASQKVHPQVIFSEIPTGSQSAVAAFGLGIAMGILASIDIPVIQILPHETKLATGLTKKASKQAMIDWAVEMYPNLNWPTNKHGVMKKSEHLADALAVIHAGVKSDQFQQLLAIYRER